MGVRRFLLDGPVTAGALVELSSIEARHAIKVLRLRPGDEVELLDGQGFIARGVIDSIRGKNVFCLAEQVSSRPQAEPELVICPGLLKNPAMDILAVKLSELMVSRVRPFITPRSVPRLKDAAKRVMRWQGQSLQALKQCGSAHAPVWHEPLELEKLLALAPEKALKLLLYESEDKATLAEVMKQKKNITKIWCVIGPEGGFAPQEVEAARKSGFIVCGLPGAVLRAETACLAVASVIRLGGF